MVCVPDTRSDRIPNLYFGAKDVMLLQPSSACSERAISDVAKVVGMEGNELQDFVELGVIVRYRNRTEKRAPDARAKLFHVE